MSACVLRIFGLHQVFEVISADACESVRVRARKQRKGELAYTVLKNSLGSEVTLLLVAIRISRWVFCVMGSIPNCRISSGSANRIGSAGATLESGDICGR